MGLLDLPAPVFEALDETLLRGLPPTARLIVWAVVAGVISMLLYRVLSPQSRIKGTKAAAVDARRKLHSFDGELRSALPLMRESLTLALKQVWLVLPSTLVASLPVLTLLVWLDTTYGYSLPPAGVNPAVSVTPSEYSGIWVGDTNGGQIEVRDPAGQVTAKVDLREAVPTIERRHWWNLLIDNPAGYLADEGPVERISIDLPARDYLPFGPDWVRSWLTVFLSILVATSFGIYRAARMA